MLWHLPHFSLLALLAIEGTIGTPIDTKHRTRIVKRSSCLVKSGVDSSKALAVPNNVTTTLHGQHNGAHGHHKGAHGDHNHTSSLMTEVKASQTGSLSVPSSSLPVAPSSASALSSAAESSKQPPASSTPATPESKEAATSTTTHVAATSAPSKTPAAPSPSTTPAPTSTTPSPTPSTPAQSANPQVGIAWSSDSGSNIASFADASNSKLSWYYNWGLSSTLDAKSLEFAPMVWGSGSVGDVKSASAGWTGVTHVLSFNEPDQSTSVGGSGISAGDAANLHQQWVSTVGGSYKIGSPAVARGGGTWLDAWFSACDSKCQVDFIPFHFYGTSAQDLITYAQQFHSKYNKPLWLTEWACQDYSSGQICSAADAQTFMDTAISAFRNDPTTGVARWAYFGAFAGEAAAGNGNALENASGGVSFPLPGVDSIR